MQVVSPVSTSELRKNRIVFAVLLAIFCCWVLSLPVFPSQDGPAHKFYAGVLGSELFGAGPETDYSQSYVVRMPVPSYAAQDYILATASRFMDVDLADKLFVCLVMIATAVGMRLCCAAMGEAGLWASLFVMPLLLHWSLMMGFMNYSLGLGLLLIAFAAWMRLGDDARGVGWWITFVLVSALMMFTHPVTLMMLVLLCGYDFATQTLWAGSARGIAEPAESGFAVGAVNAAEAGAKRRLVQRGVAMAVLVAALAYPLLNVDPSRSAKEIKHSMFHLHTYINDLMLVGLSPFHRHAPSIPITLYRASLYVLLLGALFLAGRGLRDRLRTRKLERNDFMLIAAVVLYVLIPIMPDSVNGALDFFIRMLIMVWVLALFAASRLVLGSRGRQVAVLASIGFAAIALLPAELSSRPAARQVVAMQNMVLPRNAHGLILITLQEAGPAANFNLVGNPFMWSSMVPMLRAHDVMINVPWIDATYMSLKAGNDPRLLYNVLGTQAERQNIDQHDGDLSHDTVDEQKRVLAGTDFVVAVYSGAKVADLAGPLGEQAQGFACDNAARYLLCFPRQSETKALALDSRR